MNSRAEVYKRPDLFVSSMLLMLVEDFGAPCLQWEPETIQMELKAVMGCDPSALVLDKANAALTLAGSNQYHKSVEAFMALNRVMSLRPIAGADLASPDVDEIAWGVSEAKLIEGQEEFDTDGFTHDIRLYVGLALGQEGIDQAPPMLKFAEFDPQTQANAEMLAIDDPLTSDSYNNSQSALSKSIELATAQKLMLLLKQFKELPIASEETFKSRVEAAMKSMSKTLEQEQDYAALD